MSTLLQKIEILFKENKEGQIKTNDDFKTTLNLLDSRLQTFENIFPAKTKQFDLAQNCYSIFNNSEDSNNNNETNQNEKFITVQKQNTTKSSTTLKSSNSTLNLKTHTDGDTQSSEISADTLTPITNNTVTTKTPTPDRPKN
jgi:hypothetical protein